MGFILSRFFKSRCNNLVKYKIEGHANPLTYILLPHSLQTVTVSVSGRASAVGQEVTTKQRPEDKKSPLKTQNEKKSIQGISKSIMPKKSDVQKFMAMAAMGILTSSNKVQTRRK